MSVKEADDARGLACLFLVVGDHNDGPSVVAVESVEDVHDLGAHLGVKVARRLVGQDDFRVADDGPRDGHALTLSAGELRGEVLHAVAQAHPGEHFLGGAAAFLRGDVAVEERQLHVVKHAERGDEVEALEDEAERAVAEGSELLVLHAAGLLPVNLDAARRGRVEQAQHVEQRGLAAARRAHDADKLSFADVQVDILQSQGFNLVGAIHL